MSKGFIRTYARPSRPRRARLRPSVEAYLKELEDKEREKTKPHRANVDAGRGKAEGPAPDLYYSFAGAAVLVIIIVSFYFILSARKSARLRPWSLRLLWPSPADKQVTEVKEVPGKPDVKAEAPAKAFAG